MSNVIIYIFSVWGISLLLWWDKCASRMDKLKTRKFKKQTLKPVVFCLSPFVL